MSVFTPTYFPNSLGMFAMKIYRHLVMTKSCSIIISENLDFSIFYWPKIQIKFLYQFYPHKYKDNRQKNISRGGTCSPPAMPPETNFAREPDFLSFWTKKAWWPWKGTEWMVLITFYSYIPFLPLAKPIKLITCAWGNNCSKLNCLVWKFPPWFSALLTTVNQLTSLYAGSIFFFIRLIVSLNSKSWRKVPSWKLPDHPAPIHTPYNFISLHIF